MRRRRALSIYKVHFRGDSHRYGYDLGELADFHNLYTDIMAHWRSVLPALSTMCATRISSPTRRDRRGR